MFAFSCCCCYVYVVACVTFALLIYVTLRFVVARYPTVGRYTRLPTRLHLPFGCFVYGCWMDSRTLNVTVGFYGYSYGYYTVGLQLRCWVTVGYRTFCFTRFPTFTDLRCYGCCGTLPTLDTGYVYHNTILFTFYPVDLPHTRLRYVDCLLF